MQIDERWRLLPFSEGPAGEELAAGEALLAGLGAAGGPAVRWYSARRLALVLGSGQRLSEVDGAAAAAAGATIHKRGSGGTAVLFVPGFLMQDIVLPVDHPLWRDDVSESYRWLGAVWSAALHELGIATSLVSTAEARADAQTADPLVRRACFGGRSPYEVLASGRKLVGFSQKRRRGGALFQVGLYSHWPGAELARILRLLPAERAAMVDALAGRVIGLDELINAPPRAEQVRAAFAGALRAAHGVSLEAAPWRPEEQQAARAAGPRFAPLDPAATSPPMPSS